MNSSPQPAYSDKNVTIHILGPYSVLEGDFPKSKVMEVTSYPVDGAEFSKAFKRGAWDGRKYLFSDRTQRFPT